MSNEPIRPLHLRPTTSTALATALSRTATRPAEAQEELATYAAEIEAALAASEHIPTDAELAGTDRGLADALAGRFAAGEQVAAVFARHRRP